MDSYRYNNLLICKAHGEAVFGKDHLNSSIKPWMYVRRSTMCGSAAIRRSGTNVSKISYVACELNPIKIDFSDYPKRFINKLNEVYAFSIDTAINY